MSTDNMKTCRELYEQYDRLVDALLDGIAPVYTLDELRDIASDLERVPCETPGIRRSIVTQIHTQVRLLSTIERFGTDENCMLILVCVVNLGSSIMGLWQTWLDAETSDLC